MNWFLVALKKYATFSGRSRRSEYWYFILFYLLICIVLGILDGIIGSSGGASGIGILSAFVIGYLASLVLPARDGRGVNDGGLVSCSDASDPR